MARIYFLRTGDTHGRGFLSVTLNEGTHLDTPRPHHVFMCLVNARLSAIPITVDRLRNCPSSKVHNLTYTLILHPIARQALSASPVCSSSAVPLTIVQALSHWRSASSLSCACTFVAFVSRHVLWSNCNAVNTASLDFPRNTQCCVADLSALRPLLFSSVCTSTCGTFGPYRRRRYGTLPTKCGCGTFCDDGLRRVFVMSSKYI